MGPLEGKTFSRDNESVLSSTGALGLFWFERFYKPFALPYAAVAAATMQMLWQAWCYDLASMAELACFHFPDIQEGFCQSMRSTGKCFSSWVQTSLAFSVNCSSVHVQRVYERAHHRDRELMMRCRYWDCCIATRRAQENDAVSSPPSTTGWLSPLHFFQRALFALDEQLVKTVGCLSQVIFVCRC